MSSFVLSSGAVLFAKPESIVCAADVDLPGRVRLVEGGRTVARGLAALRAAWPLLSDEVRAVVNKKPEPSNPAAPKKREIASDWSDATVDEIATTQPSVLRRAASDPHLLQIMAFRSAGEPIGWRSLAESLRDAGFVSFSLNRPSPASDDGEDRGAFVGTDSVAPAPLVGTLSRSWGVEAIEERWRRNGPIVRVTRLRNGRVSAQVNRFGPVSTLYWVDGAGRQQVMADLSPMREKQARSEIAKVGGTVERVTVRDRWYSEPCPAGPAARAVARFEEWERSLPPKQERVRAAALRRRMRGAEIPVGLRYDLVAEEANALVEDRGRLDESPEVMHALYWRTRRKMPAKWVITRDGARVRVLPERYEVTYRLLSGWLTDHQMDELLADRPVEVLRRIWVRTETRGPVADSASVAEFGTPIARTGCPSPVRSFLR